MFMLWTSADGVSVTDDKGRCFDIEKTPEGGLELYSGGLVEDSNHPFSESQFAPEVYVRLTPEQAGDFMAALSAWMDLLNAPESHRNAP